mmetsp:Transcript_11071/g.41305  ORF Transcript_11071/g.41305 Transcript_11071/m.41305 type:complete len:560 (+) Transcript_11071:294-1973(+)
MQADDVSCSVSSPRLVSSPATTSVHPAASSNTPGGIITSSTTKHFHSTPRSTPLHHMYQPPIEPFPNSLPLFLKVLFHKLSQILLFSPLESSSLIVFLSDAIYLLITLYFSFELILSIVFQYKWHWGLGTAHVLLDSWISFVEIPTGMRTIRGKLLLQRHEQLATHSANQIGRLAIAKHYLLSWFVVDATSAIPLDAIMLILYFSLQPQSHAFLVMSQIYRFLRLIKLVRVIKIPFLFQTTAGSFKGRIRLLSKILIFVFWFLTAIHWVSCIWILLRPNDAKRHNDFTRYVLGILWVTETLSTVGLGQVTTETSLQRLYASLVMIFGVTAYGFCIANVSIILMNKDTVKSNQQKQISALFSLMSFYKIPYAVQQEVMTFQQNAMQQSAIDNYSKLIQNLPESMQHRIRSYVKMKIISRFSLFKDLSTECLESLALALQQIYVDPGDEIIRYGDMGQEMFFVSHGSLEVITPQGVQVAIIENSAFVGEIALFFSSKRTATVRALTYCSLFELKKDDFMSIMKMYPELKARVKIEVKRRIEEVKTSGSGGGDVKAETSVNA